MCIFYVVVVAVVVVVVVAVDVVVVVAVNDDEDVDDADDDVDDDANDDVDDEGGEGRRRRTCSEKNLTTTNLTGGEKSNDYLNGSVIVLYGLYNDALQY